MFHYKDIMFYNKIIINGTQIAYFIIRLYEENCLWTNYKRYISLHFLKTMKHNHKVWNKFIIY